MIYRAVVLVLVRLDYKHVVCEVPETPHTGEPKRLDALAYINMVNMLIFMEPILRVKNSSSVMLSSS